MGGLSILKRSASASIVAAAALAGCATLAGRDVRQVTYGCETGPDLSVVFDDGTARVMAGEGSVMVLQQRPAASGFSYESATHALRGQGIDATYTAAGSVPVRCRQNNTDNM